MSSNWNEIKWIFESDRALRDLYVRNVNLKDWKILITFLNDCYEIKYGPSGENKILNEIDSNYVAELLISKSSEIEFKTASIITNEIIINTHFFYDKEIEFDIDPKEINSQKVYDKLIDFMKNISRILNKEVILTGENQIEFPLITVDYSKQKVKAITKKEAQELWDIK